MHAYHIALLLMFAALTGALWLARDAQQELEKVELQLDQMTQSRNNWMAACADAQNSAQAQRRNAEACIQREADASADAVERTAIMKQAQPEAPKSNRKVVDNATRKRVVDRLNRPL